MMDSLRNEKCGILHIRYIFFTFYYDAQNYQKHILNSSFILNKTALSVGEQLGVQTNPLQ